MSANYQRLQMRPIHNDRSNIFSFQDVTLFKEKNCKTTRLFFQFLSFFYTMAV